MPLHAQHPTNCFTYVSSFDLHDNSEQINSGKKIKNVPIFLAFESQVTEAGMVAQSPASSALRCSDFIKEKKKHTYLQYENPEVCLERCVLAFPKEPGITNRCVAKSRQTSTR